MSRQYRRSLSFTASQAQNKDDVRGSGALSTQELLLLACRRGNKKEVRVCFFCLYVYILEERMHLRI